MRLLRAVILASMAACSLFGQSYTISTIAGGELPVNVQGASAPLYSSGPVAVDSTGNVFFADSAEHVILRLDAVTGLLTLAAGTGTPGFSGDDGPATSAQLNQPWGVAVDSVGNLYIADTGNERIRMVSSGLITTVAGNGAAGFGGDNGPATSAQLRQPTNLALDASGDLYIADYGNQRVRKVSAGVITTVAGNGTAGFSGDGGPASSAELNFTPDYSLGSPADAGLAVDTVGNLYIADQGNFRVREVSNGVITTIAGNGTSAFSGDNGPATSAEFVTPMDVALDTAGNLYVADHVWIRKISGGVITTVAGGDGLTGGDGGPATSAGLAPVGLAIDGAGDIYIGDSDFNTSSVRKVSSGIINTVAGNSSLGDGGPATGAPLIQPPGVAVNTPGSLYIGDVHNTRIRLVSGGVITTVAGDGFGNVGGDGGLATSAGLGGLSGNVAVDSAGNLYIAEGTRVREVSGDIITTVAGNGTSGFSGDNGPATSAQLSYAYGVAIDSSGNLYIADEDGQRIRKVSNGVITTVAGNGTEGFSGDNGPAVSAQLSYPTGVAVDGAGNLYIADYGNLRIREVSDGVITTVAGNGTAGFSGDNGPPTSARLDFPDAVAVDSSGSLYIADHGNQRIRKVSNRVITTVAGNGTAGFSGDNGPAVSAQLDGPLGVAVDTAGNVYVADSLNNRIRLLTPTSNGSSPAEPTLISPDNGATGVSLSTSLTWSAASGATSYNVYFGTISPPPVYTTNLAQTSWSLSGLTAGTTYYWQIVASNGTNTASSAIWSFTTGPAGACTYGLSATSASVSSGGGTGSVSVTTQPGCTWTAMNNPSWVTFTSGASSFSSGAVDYSVAANTGGPRSATLTIAGNSFVITQLGTYLIETIAGGMLPPTALAAIAVSIGNPQGVAVDASGNTYFASESLNAVFRLDPSGVLTRVAGTGSAGYSGDNGPALSAQLYIPFSVAVDSSGNLYIADEGNSRIREVSTGGIITTVAGGGSSLGDGGPATAAQLSEPYGVAVDSSGNLYIADTFHYRIREVSNGTINTIAGNGTNGSSGDNGPASSAEVGAVYGVAVDSSGNVYVSDPFHYRVRKISGGTITTVAGTGTYGCSGDNGPATSAEFAYAFGLAVDSSGNLYIADPDCERVREVSNGTITTVAGDGAIGYLGDGGAATSAELYFPEGVAVDPLGNLYVADNANQRIRKVSAGTISTVAGGANGDTGPAPFAGFYPTGFTGIVKDASGNVYVADSDDNRVRKITSAGVVVTVAGTGVPGYSGDNGPATSAQLNQPYGLALDASGNLYIADEGNDRIRQVTPAGTIATVAGNGQCCYSGDNGPANNAELHFPVGVATDSAGNLYIADSANNRIREVSNGTITTVAGNGTSGFSGDTGPATSAELDYPEGLAVDAAGNLYIADSGNSRVRKVSNGIITTVAGGGTAAGDSGPATSAQLYMAAGIAVDSAGNLYVADSNLSAVRMVTPSGMISIIAGGTYGNSGDGGPAVNAALARPQGLAVDNSGNVYVADTGNNNLRLVMPAGGAALLTVASTHTGSFTPGAIGTYTVTVSNAAGTGATSGAVTATDIVPSALTITSMAGNGWSCVLSTSTCTNSSVLTAGSSSSITVTVNVASPAPVQVTNQMTVSGGGAAAMTGSEDLTLLGGVVPAAPLLVSPANGATGVSLSPTLTWNAASGATSYNVYFGTTSPPPSVTNTANTSYSPAGLAAGTTYYWQIAASSGAHTASSQIWSFVAGPAGACTYVLGATSGSATVGGGSASVPVTTQLGCTWTATSNQSWLTVTSGASSFNSGTVDYSVATNTGGPRSATLTIAGQSFTVMQLGAYLIETIAAGNLPATAEAASSAAIGDPQSVAADAEGNIYFTSFNLNSVFRLDTSGTLTRVAGTGVAGYSGDNGPALSAQLNSPWGLAVDASGNLYIADEANSRIREVSTSGTITTVAGGGSSYGDGGPATSAQLDGPYGVALDPSGNLYIADTFHYRIREVSGGTITTIAGNGTYGYSGDNGPATSAEMRYVYGLTVDSSGNVYIADYFDYRIRKISGGMITTVAGTGTYGYSGDNGPATSAEISEPYGVAVDSSGNLYIADTFTGRVRVVNTGGIITTVAGNGGFGYAGGGGVATSAELADPYGVAEDPFGNLYIADYYNQRIRKVSAGTISTAAGGVIGDTGPAPFATINYVPSAVKDNKSGNIYVADYYGNRVRVITPAGVIATYAGTGVGGYGGDNGPATSALLDRPSGLAVDGSGNLYITDTDNQRIRMVSSSGNITTVAGSGTYGFSGDTGPATSAALEYPEGVAVDKVGNLYIADTDNQRIREVSGGIISTIAGTGSEGYSGDNGPATSGELDYPYGVAVDGSGNVYIADTDNLRIREVSGGTITTVAGTGSCCYSGDNGPATSAAVYYPEGVAVDVSGNLYIADTDNDRIRVVSGGIISTIAGGSYGYSGDGGLATGARMRDPEGVAVDGAGNVYVADTDNNVVRLVVPAGGAALLSVASTHTGSFTPGSTGQYTLTVSNAASAGPTSGTVTVTDLVPAGLTITSMSASAPWNCGANSCTRSDVLAAGSSYLAITVNVSVGAPAPTQVTNQATVSGGGAALTGSEDLTLLGGTVPAVPVLISPANGATGVSLSPSLTWSTASGATSYNVYFGTTSPPPFMANTANTSYSVTGLAAGTTYYWQVVASSGAHAASSQIWSFITGPAGVCTYTLSPTSVSLPGNAVTGSVSVTTQAGCTWTATSNQTWLTVTSGASGVGSGTVDYSAAVNSGVSRSATLTIAGQSFVATQIGGTLFSDLGPNNVFGTDYNGVFGSTATIDPTSQTEAALFTVAGSGSQAVTEIDLGAGLAGCECGPTTTFYASIWTDASGVPGTQVPGAYWTFKNTTEPGQLVSIKNISGVLLTGGANYFMVLGPLNITDDGYLGWYLNNQGVAGGYASSTNGGASWSGGTGAVTWAFDVLGGSTITLQGGPPVVPVSLPSGSTAQVTGSISGSGSQAYYAFSWPGGPFSATAAITSTPNSGASYLFSLGVTGSCNSLGSATLNANDSYIGTIASSNLSAGNYCIGIDATNSNDPTFTITFSIAVTGATLSCNVKGNTTVGVSDVQQMISEALGMAQPANDLNADGVVNVSDVEIVLNAALGQACLAGSVSTAVHTGAVTRLPAAEPKGRER